VTVRVRQAIVGVAMVIAVAAACSSTTETIDAGKLERSIKSFLEKSNRVTSIECPEDVKLEKGATFTCAARIEGTRQIIDVTQKNDKGSVVFGVRS
jgi:hypothetical protein